MDTEVLFRDSCDIQPEDGGYTTLPPAAFVACPEDIWRPVKNEDEDDGLVEVKAKTQAQIAVEQLKKRISLVLDSRYMVGLVTVMTVWALFIEDLLIGIPEVHKSADEACGYITLLFLIIFMVEWVARSFAQYEEYCFSFFWFMDFAANISMVFQLSPIVSDLRTCSVPGFMSFGTTSAFRLARVMRLLRVIRVVRVFASCSKQSSNPQSVVRKNQQSAIGKRINEMLVRSMILIVISLQLIEPILSFNEVDVSRSLAFSMLKLARNTTAYPLMLDQYHFQGSHNYDVDGYVGGYFTLLKVVIDGQPTVFAEDGTPVGDAAVDAACLAGADWWAGCPPSIARLRCSDLLTYPEGARPTDADVVYWSNEPMQRREAWLNIVMMVILAFLILSMFIALSMDVTSMVVQPIESMVGLVRRLAENPTLQLEGQSKSKYETEAVRIALAKIVGLMQLGFGGAGHEIISANLANSEQTGLDLMLRGKKKECAYGFCDIRQFTDTVECLQDQVMLFTNSVGEIVHQACHDNRGEPNKNIGDAFLIVWRPRSLSDHTKIVDGALTAFRRCVREIASSQTLQLVTNVEAIHKKFGRGKYRTKLGFGLHFGWSVEGPVGSPTKIDCSYLSPEVKISDRLEAATKIYSSNILMSGQFYDLLSDHIKVGIRLIDHVTLKGGVKPFRIYADDRSNLWLRMNPKLVDIYGAEAAYEQFSKTFHEGVDAFIKGDWPTAQQKLEGAHDFCPKDVPTMLLMKEMKKRSIDQNTPTAPVDWKGYHDSEV